MIKKLVIPFSSKIVKEIDLLFLTNSIYSIKKVGYEILFVTEESYWELVKDRLRFIVNDNELLFIENKYNTYYGTYKFNYYNYLIENWDNSVMVIDYDTYLNDKFIEPEGYDILCSTFNYNTHHDIRYTNSLGIKHSGKLVSINAGLMKFNNLDTLIKYYELVNRKDILNDFNVMYYEQILPVLSLDITWGYYYDSRSPVNPPYWHTSTHLLECHVDFTNKDNQFSHFMGNLKHDKYLLSLLNDNLKVIYKEYNI